MKRLYVWLAIACFASVLSAQELKELHIFHTSDLHSRIEPMPETDPNQEYAGNGGMVRIASLANELRNKHTAMLLFDCGDFSQGTPYYNLFKGELEVKMMNEIGYDAVAIGNHEFDFGLENMARIFRMAKFPILCANYHFEGTPVEGLVKPYVIFYRDGMKIGVFALGTPLEGMVQAKCREGVRYENPIEAAQRITNQLKNVDRCDLIICLSHLGWQNSDTCDEVLIPNTKDIDVVIGGHSHSYFEKPKIYKNMDGKDVTLHHMGKSGVYLGKICVKMQKD